MKVKIMFILRIVVALILFQTLYFKFSGAPESIYIFSTLKIEPWGRWFAGGSELVAGIMLLIPSTQILGALLAAGIMSGALASHILFLGISVQGDGGLLFGLACVVFVFSGIVVFENRSKVIDLLKKLRGF
jgi:uncharacterized membrane protein YphA (DoxX/SURF4 family)